MGPRLRFCRMRKVRRLAEETTVPVASPWTVLSGRYGRAVARACDLGIPLVVLVAAGYYDAEYDLLLGGLMALCLPARRRFPGSVGDGSLPPVRGANSGRVIPGGTRCHTWRSSAYVRVADRSADGATPFRANSCSHPLS